MNYTFYRLSALSIENSENVHTPYGIDIQKFSSYSKLVRVTAWVTRFIHNLKKRPLQAEKFLTYEELDKAEKLWIRYVQKKNFAEVIHSISCGEKNNLRNQLGVFLDDECLLRCKGRLEHAELNDSSRFPILFPRGEDLTRLLVEKVHQEQFHSGVSLTLCKLRKKLWIPQGRATVRQIIRHCRICKRFDGGPYKMPNMAPFPKCRVTKSLPFQGTGLDYLGPIYIKRNGECVKIWICLFTCFVTRAIHLELVNDMTTEEFLYALRRFISIRGTPCDIISDNASQFKLGSEVVGIIWKNIVQSEDVQSFVSSLGIKWKFITELAPWMGGFYERLVGVIKRCLRKTLQKRCITDIQMLTILKEIEAVINSRPLVYIDEDIDSRLALSPNHFLSIHSENGIPEIDYDLKDRPYSVYETSAEKLIKLWKKGQTILNSFWKRWQEEYLQGLRERKQIELKSGRIKSNVSPNVGAVVVLKEELPRGMWKLGVIVQLVKSTDGQIRSAKLRLASGNVVGRPLSLLYPLEVDSEECSISNDKNCAAPVDHRPKRQSAEVAKKKIKECI